MAYKFVELWETIQQANYLFNLPTSCQILIDMWTLIRNTNPIQSTNNLWAPIIKAYPDLPFSNLVKIFFSLVYIFSFNHNVPARIVPNHIQEGDCLANYLCNNLCHPQGMPSLIYPKQFKCSINLLDNVEVLWLPHITTTKHKSIFNLPSLLCSLLRPSQFHTTTTSQGDHP